MTNLDQLFKSKEWLEIRTGTLKTDKTLSRVEFLKEIGWEKFTEGMYQEYLKAMQSEGRELVYEN